MARARDTPRAEAVSDADDAPVTVDEDDVDREPHEEHVYRGSAVDQHPAARIEPVAAEQAAHAPERAFRYLAALADNGAVRSTADARDRCTGHRSSMPAIAGGRSATRLHRAWLESPSSAPPGRLAECCVRPRIGRDSAAMVAIAVERRRAALMSADAAGYSRLMAADELATIQTIKVFREAGEEIAREHGGRLVDSPGDNLLFEFEHAAGAVEAALLFQAFVLETNEAYEPQERMQFRIGLHSGEVVVDSDRIYGSGINIAARLERLARPGGICISHSVRDEADVPHTLEDIGPQYVKNIPHPIHAFFVDVPGQVVPAKPAMSAWPSIAVLPVETAEGDADAEYLADGMAEDLITTLAMWHQFPVIARNSTFLYKGRALGPEVGEELGAEYLVVGSLRRVGERVRISAQLLDAGSMQHLWADRWNSTLEDAFETGDEIAQAI